MTISPNLDAMSRPAHLFTPPGCHSLTAGAHSQCSSVQYTYTHMHAHCKHYSVKVTFVWLYSSFSVYLTGEYYTTKDIVAFPCCACELQHSLSICGLQYVNYSNFQCCNTPNTRCQRHPPDGQLWANAMHMHGVQQTNLLQL